MAVKSEKNNVKGKTFQKSTQCGTGRHWQALLLKHVQAYSAKSTDIWKKQKGKEEIQSDRQTGVKILLWTYSVIMLVPKLNLWQSKHTSCNINPKRIQTASFHVGCADWVEL